MFEVFGLDDVEPYYLACEACATHALGLVHGAYSVFEPAAPDTCELAYDGICTAREARSL